MQVFAAGTGTAAARLKIRSLKLNVQGIHKAVHQPAERCDGCQLNNFRVVEMLCQLRKRVIVVARLVPGDPFGPADDGFFTFAK
jgi:hypothetical protein